LFSASSFAADASPTDSVAATDSSQTESPHQRTVLGQLPGATEDEVFAETFEDGEAL
jgi:hypothetical protein